ncbi:phosphoribosylglycinamide formyltransferase, partial [Pseudomonas sp. GW456-E7]
MKKFAVFASGNGSNFEAIVTRLKEEKWDASVSLLVCDKPEAKVIERAETFHIPSFAFEPKSYENKAAFERAIIEQLHLHDVELIVLA